MNTWCCHCHCDTVLFGSSSPNIKTIILSRNDFSSSGGQSERRLLYVITTNCRFIVIFQTYCCCIKHIFNKFVTTKSLKYITDMSKYHNAGVLTMDQKNMNCYVQKHIALLAICYNPPLVHDTPLGVPAYCETRLLDNSTNRCHTYLALPDQTMWCLIVWCIEALGISYRTVSV